MIRDLVTKAGHGQTMMSWNSGEEFALHNLGKGMMTMFTVNS